MKNVEVFLPCRRGSERVPNKNTRPFHKNTNGLLERKLLQLQQVQRVCKIVLDTNDPLVLEIGKHVASNWGGIAELVIRERPDHLGQSSTTTDELINYALKHTTSEHLLWTHVTSPFLDAGIYNSALETYEKALEKGHDSLMSVTRLQSFIWSSQGAVNYDPSQLRWPRSQDLEPLFEINSGIFLVPLDIAKTRMDRIGSNPKLFELDKFPSVDIDWPEDFTFAESVARSLEIHELD